MQITNSHYCHVFEVDEIPNFSSETGCSNQAIPTKRSLGISILQRFFVQIYQNFPTDLVIFNLQLRPIWRFFGVTSCRVKNRFISNAPNFHFEMAETLRLKLDIAFYEGDNDGYEVRDHLNGHPFWGIKLDANMLNFREFFFLYNGVLFGLVIIMISVLWVVDRLSWFTLKFNGFFSQNH